jgi:RNA polymerase sigma factor (sigma-70 family)
VGGVWWPPGEPSLVTHRRWGPATRAAGGRQPKAFEPRLARYERVWRGRCAVIDADGVVQVSEPCFDDRASTGGRDFDEFYRSTVGGVVHLVYACTGDLGLAQDATQEAYARAWTDWDSVGSLAQPLAWVRTVARRRAISEWRRGRVRLRSAARLDAVSFSPAPDENRVAVVTALRTLEPVLRETLALYYLADLSIEQIGAEQQVPAGTVKARLHRGRLLLADRLRTHDEEPRR